jgi:SAM-dependent methyltransferase
MAERNTGVRRVLMAPSVYEAAQRLLGSPRVRREFVTTYVRPEPGARVLDIGCGPGDLRGWLPEVRYVGFDLNPHYIESARARFGDRGEFFVGDVAAVDREELGQFDIVIAKGVLHHLDDASARRLFALAAAVLVPEGRIATIDPALTTTQSRAARFVVRRDRGLNVRTPDGYAALGRTAFDAARVEQHHHLLRVPYTHVAMVCERPFGTGSHASGSRSGVRMVERP